LFLNFEHKLFFYICIPKSRLGSQQYFKNLFPTISVGKVLICTYKRVSSFADSLLDRIYLLVRGSSEFAVDFPGTKNVLDALDKKKGVIILSAHIGNWEVVSRFFTRLKSKVSVVVYEAEREDIKTIYVQNSKTKKVPFDFIYINDPLDAIIQIKNALSRNEIVVMHGDRTMGKGEMHFFLGKKAKFPILPYAIAAKTGAPIVIAFSVRLKNMVYRAVTYPHFVLESTIKESVSLGLNTYISILESILKQYPFQWYNFYRFWD